MCPVVSDNFDVGRSGGEQGTKYEVKELGTAGLHGGVERMYSRNDAWELNPYTAEKDVPRCNGRLQSA